MYKYLNIIMIKIRRQPLIKLLKPKVILAQVNFSGPWENTYLLWLCPCNYYLTKPYLT